MSNDEVYASGLLIRALDAATQPPPIQTFMQAEIEFLDAFVGASTTWLDVGCGTGRHLALLHHRLRLGVGVDYEEAYVADAHRRVGGPLLHFIVGDAAHLPLRARFNLSTCLMNTWGTMSDKPGVLAEMRRCAEVRLLSVFSERSMA